MIRIRNESTSVRRKAVAAATKQRTTFAKPRSLSQSVDLRARDSFFANHVLGNSKTWDFLEPYYDTSDSPDHLSYSIDAVSLAYLSHQTDSDAILATACQKYGMALTLTRKALQSSELAAKDTTLLTSLLLDMFEKITNTEPRHIDSWASHLNGALTLVQLRGLDQLKDPSTLRALIRLSTNLLINCVATESIVPDELLLLREHAEKYINIDDPKWKLSGLIAKSANLRNLLLTTQLPVVQRVELLVNFDVEFEALERDMPMYKTFVTDFESENIFGHRVDLYPDRHATQTWNVLRIVRTLLNETILEECLKTPSKNSEQFSPKFESQASKANMNIQLLGEGILASVPQYSEYFGIDYDKLGLARGIQLSEGSPSQMLHCYSLIFPLYVAGRSMGSSSSLKQWAIKQLRYMASRFDIRNAELVASILEVGRTTNPWSIYALLGSYAFSA